MQLSSIGPFIITKLHFTLNYDISRKIILRVISKCYSTYVVVGNQGVVSTDLNDLYKGLCKFSKIMD